MLLWLLRGCYVLILIGIAAVAFNNYYSQDEVGNGVKAVLIILLIGGTVLLTDLREKSKEITTISAVYFGLLLGLLLGSLFGSALDPFLRDWFPNQNPDRLSPMAQLSRIFITLLS